MGWLPHMLELLQESMTSRMGPETEKLFQLLLARDWDEKKCHNPDRRGKHVQIWPVRNPRSDRDQVL
jgi:hypothetical protein